MDRRRFDDMTRVLGGRIGRRAALRGLAAALLGGAVAVPAVAQAANRSRTCRWAGQACLQHGQCCSQQCDTARTTPRARRNRCVCPEGLATCGGHCVGVDSDTTHCGGCFQRCGRGADVCVNGQCQCGDGEICDGPLVDRCIDGACVCGKGGDACDADRADQCANGFCRCGDGPPCDDDRSCVDGTCFAT
jgi:hypothetical protein